MVARVPRRFAVALAALVVALGWLSLDPERLVPLEPVAVLTAQATAGLLRAGGIEATRSGRVVLHPDGFAIEVDVACAALAPLALLAVAVVALPAPLSRRFVGLLLLVPALLALNLLRLIHLFVLGVHAPQWFDLFHDLLWRAAALLGLLGTWLAWRHWAVAQPRSPAH